MPKQHLLLHCGGIMLSLVLILSPALMSAFPTPDADPSSSGCTSTNPEAFYDGACWAELGLSDWLNNWHAPKTCEPSDNGVGCCKPNEEWSTCFLRLGKGDSGLNCTQINTNTNDCTYEKGLATELDPSIYAQVRYITKTIFSESVT